MLKAVVCGLGLAFLSGASSRAQVGTPQPIAVEMANLREDVRLLSQRVGELSLKCEQLERENGELRARHAAASNALQAYVTAGQLNDAVSDLNRAIKAGDTSAREQTAAQIKELGRQTNAAIDALAKGMATRAPVQTSFSDDFPKEGVGYTVQKGDTVAVIARKTGGKVADIINANKISDPSKIQVGQTLFIPGGK